MWAYRKEQATGIDKEIWIGANSFTHDILYNPVYAPLFIINDTVLVFDQYKNKDFISLMNITIVLVCVS